MRFAPTEEQRAFASSLDDLLAAADVPAAVRQWADGEHRAGLDLWDRLADLGLTALCVPESAGGLGATPADMVVAFERLGYHLVPGPYVESVVLAPALLPTADGASMVTVAAPPDTPYALDADVAAETLLLAGDRLHRAVVGEPRRSVDTSRRLFTVTAGEFLGTVTGAATAVDAATLACSAQLLGAGVRLLRESVEYAKTRTQFGRPIGEYQALKHELADVRVGLDFARPLVYRAALSLGAGSADTARDTSAAKVAVSGAAYRAARTALQTHGAIGYTLEYDLGLWITKVQALTSAWGTPAAHRTRVLSALVA